METIVAQTFGSVNLYTLLAVLLWTLPWKAWSLWLAARRGDLWWFFAILIINTFGILEMIYIFLIAKQSDARETREIPNP